MYSLFEERNYFKNVTTSKGVKKIGSFKNNILVPSVYIPLGELVGVTLVLQLNENVDMSFFIDNFKNDFNGKKRVTHQGKFIDVYFDKNIPLIEYDAKNKFSTYELNVKIHLTGGSAKVFNLMQKQVKNRRV
jgi:hypothetical protein